MRRSLKPPSEAQSGRTPARQWALLGALVGLVVGLALTYGVAARSGDRSTLIHFAPPFTEVESAPDGVVVLPERRGYDGQFYWRLAADPFSTANRVDGVALDHPALRTTRIGYPAAARSLQFVTGGRVATVDALLMVNVIALSMLGAAACLVASDAGRRPVTGLVILGVPAFVYGTTMAVTDALAGALLVCALAAWNRERWLLATVCLSGAVLTRETALLVPVVGLVVIAIGASRGRTTNRWSVIVAAVPVLIACAWQVVVIALWGEVGPLSAGGENLTVPLAGAFQTPGFFSPASGEELLNLLVPAATLVVISLAGIAIARGEVVAAQIGRLGQPLLASFGVASLVAVSMGPALLVTYRNSVRGLGDATLLAVVIALYGRGRWSRLSLTAVALLGLTLATWELRIAPDLS